MRPWGFITIAIFCVFATIASAKLVRSKDASLQHDKHTKLLHHLKARHNVQHRKPRHLATRAGTKSVWTGIREFFGTASYYWEDSEVATGARYDPDGLTAAHRTLPFGTRLRVTDLVSRRSVDVTVNDRGPFIAGRILDLSRGAALVLGMLERGLTQIKAIVLRHSAPTPVPAASIREEG